MSSFDKFMQLHLIAISLSKFLVIKIITILFNFEAKIHKCNMMKNQFIIFDFFLFRDSKCTDFS